jgi:uncharacterized cupin superfamily protein
MVGNIQYLSDRNLVLLNVGAAQPIEVLDYCDDPEWYAEDYDEVWYAVHE